MLLGSKKYDSIYDRIRNIISVKSGITYITSHNDAIIKADSHYSLTIEKIITFCSVTTFLKSV